MNLGSVVIGLCIAISSASWCVSAPLYLIQRFGSDGSYNHGSAGGLNELGQVAYTNSFPTSGNPVVDGPDESYFFDRGTSQKLPTLGGRNSEVFDINNQGTIVGYSESTETFTTNRGSVLPITYAVQYQNGQIEKLPVPGGFPSGASRINDRGQIIGTVVTIDNQHTFLLDPSHGYIDLGTFGGETAGAVDINNAGQVLVNSSSAGPILYYGDYAYLGVRTLIYKDGQETPLPDAASQITFGSAINELGQVAGWFHSIPGREAHAYVWDPDTGMTDISGGQYTAAADINNEGTVVGHRTIVYPTLTEAFVYTKSEGMQDLISLIPPNSGWTSLDTAVAINDRGQILGIGTCGGAIWQVFLLTPVPEPSAAILALYGFCGVACLQGRFGRT